MRNLFLFRTMCLIAAMSLSSTMFANCAEITSVNDAKDSVVLEGGSDNLVVADSVVNVAPQSAESKYIPLSSSEKQYYKDTKYWKRHNKYKTLGWTFLGVGVAALAASYIVYTSDGDNVSEDESYMQALGSVALVSVGGALTIASIPMFVLSHKNKCKAKKFDVGVTMMAEPEGLAKKPGVSLALTF